MSALQSQSDVSLSPSPKSNAEESMAKQHNAVLIIIIHEPLAKQLNADNDSIEAETLTPKSENEATKLHFLNHIMVDQFKAALIIIVAMCGTVNVKPRANYGDGSSGMMAKSSECVECKDREKSKSSECVECKDR